MSLTDIFLVRPDLLTNEKKLKGALNDYYSGDIPKINRMMRAFELGIVEALSGEKDVDFKKKTIINQLVSLYDMQEDKAKDAVSEWSKICSSKVIIKYKEHIMTEEKRKKRDQNISASQKKEKTDKKEKDQERAERLARELNTDLDDYERYYNLDLSKGKVVYGIPCGVGKSDYGFIVKGTGFEDINNRDLFPSVQALIYNFLIRDSHISKEAYPQYIKNGDFHHELDYGHVFRYMMILLDLLKPEGETILRLNLIGDQEELFAAVDILNEYLGVFCRLTKSRMCSLRVELDGRGKSISVETKADYYVINHQCDKGLRRRIRYGKRINYSLSEEDRADLEFLLKEISPFSSFKRGQYSALCSMLNANGHAVCIMPTGSGKSLVYYFACLLQPQVVFVVSPTDILIRDQIRNLKRFHHFDNVTHLDLRCENDFSFFRPGTNLIFLTPSTFQNRNLFSNFQRWKKEISYVVLDEIHCLSNWGHDFRPEYLMLSKNMLKYLDDARYLGFTATADYTVAQDIQEQLGIPYENFYSPISFEKYNLRYDFREVETNEGMLEQVRGIAKEIVRRDQRALVFTKTEEIAFRVADAIGFEADVFVKDNSDSYSHFVEGKCNILVASEELGIGVNLPNVNCTVHFGIPVSKNEFVQEIGRAGRADEKVTSYVIYLKPTERNIPAKLLRRETVINNLPQLLSSMNNDYSDAYHKLNCGADTSEILYDRLIDIYSDFHIAKKTVYTVKHSKAGIEQYKQLIYMLYITGYIKDWYTYRINENDEIEIIIDVCSVPTAGGHQVVTLDDANMLIRMKNISRGYFASMDNDRESMYKVSRASKAEDIFRIYVKWYYEKYLYHHKEQFLDFFDFLKNNKDCNYITITEEIGDYFTLPFIRIKEDEEFYKNLSFEQLSVQVINGIGRNSLTNLERINSNSYSYKLDFLLFTGRWIREGRFDEARLERLWRHLSKEEQIIFLTTMENLYPDCTIEAKLMYLNYVSNKKSIIRIGLEQIIDGIYKKAPKDMVYYGILAKSANRKLARK